MERPQVAMRGREFRLVVAPWAGQGRKYQQERSSRMKTIYDLIRHRTTLEVICTSCTHSGVLNHRYLANRFGTTKLLVEIKFVCHRCQDRRYRLRLVSDHLGAAPPLKMQCFRGAYDNRD